VQTTTHAAAAEGVQRRLLLNDAHAGVAGPRGSIVPMPRTQERFGTVLAMRGSDQFFARRCVGVVVRPPEKYIHSHARKLLFEISLHCFFLFLFLVDYLQLNASLASIQSDQWL